MFFYNDIFKINKIIGEKVNIVLMNPEMPANTGNIARTCVLTNSTLHLIKPLGFEMMKKLIRRAGLDYWPYLDLKIWDSFEHFLENMALVRCICNY